METHDMTGIQSSAAGSRWFGIVPVFFIVCATAFVCWPSVHGFWGRDDYSQLALMRMLGSPWPLFVEDHFLVAGSVFRPLGFASMWLGERLFGSAYPAHAMSELALHVGVSLLLFSLLRRMAIATLPALFGTLLFALHPAAIGTALWWSARFDLLSTTFILLSLHAGFAYRRSQTPLALVAALVAALAAMLSKEIGLIATAVLALLWLRWAWVEPAQRKVALRAVALVCLCAAVYLMWRALVLGTVSSGVTGKMPIGSAIAKGFAGWLWQAPGYFTFWVRLDVWQRLATLAIALLCAAGAVFGGSFRATAGQPAGIVLAGLCLVLLPAVLQAPVAALNAVPLRADMSTIEAAMQSRLYYLGIIGIAMMVAVLLARMQIAAPKALWMVASTTLAIALILVAGASRDEAVTYAQRSVANAEVPNAAVVAVAALDLPAAHCHVVFLDVKLAPEWGVYVSMDSMIKALTPDLDRVDRCWFHADYPTWFYLQRGPAEASDALPYLPGEVDGKTRPWRRVGDAVIAHLRPLATPTPNDLEGMYFLRWRGGRFENVSSEVLAQGLPKPLQ
jgi:hypothetical protein